MSRTLWAVTIALTAVRTTVAVEPLPADSLRLTLPADCYAIAGGAMNIYFDNIVLTEKPEQCQFRVRCNVGTTESCRWTLTPTASDVGDHAMKISVTDRNGKMHQQGDTVLHVVPAATGKASTVRLLLVGDSLTASSVYPNEIARLLRQPGNPAWSMLGTYRPASAAPDVAHEGYGGWTWQRFVSFWPPTPGKEPKDRASPFLFAEHGQPPVLDLPHYFTASCGGQRPDFVTFLLGINDCFSANPEDPAAIDTRITAMFTQAERLIAAFRKAAPQAELGICLTTPPNARESGFEANYKGKYHRWGWKRIQHRLVERQLERFAHREAEQIFLVPTELNLDPVDGYPVNNGVHPNAIGYKQIGATIYAWLKFRLAARDAK